MSSKVFEVLALAWIVHCRSYIELTASREAGDDLLADTSSCTSNQHSPASCGWLNHGSCLNLNLHPRQQQVATKQCVCRLVSSAFEYSIVRVTKLLKVIGHI